MNLQDTLKYLNLLTDDPAGITARNLIKGRRGVLVAGDFATHEVRMAAWLCKDPAMISALEVGFHTLNLAALEKLISPKEVSKCTKERHDELEDLIYKRYLKELAPELPSGIYEYHFSEVMSSLNEDPERKELVTQWKNKFKVKRTVAKESTFGPLYGMQPQSFAVAQSISIKEAEEVFRVDRETYPLKHAYFDEIKARARKDGFVQSVFGKKRRLNYKGVYNDPARIAELDRQSVNTSVQGPSSDIGALCMWECIKAFKKERILCASLGTIHDSLMHDSHPDCYKDVLQITFDIMENHPTKMLGSDHVRFKAEMEFMANWGHPKVWTPEQR